MLHSNLQYRRISGWIDLQEVQMYSDPGSHSRKISILDRNCGSIETERPKNAVRFGEMIQTLTRSRGDSS